MNDRPVAGCACRLAAAPPIRPPVAIARQASWPVLAAVSSLLLAVFPRCPVCWATYMSMFGSVWLARAPYLAWLQPLLIALAACNLLVLLRRAPRNGYLALWLGVAGFAIILVERSLASPQRWLVFCGMAGMVASSLVSSFRPGRPGTSTSQWLKRKDPS